MSIENIRHSLAHIMALAIKRLYKDVKFGVGPVTETGFYYDFEFSKDYPSEDDLEKIEKEMKKIIKENLKFEREEIEEKEAKEIFSDQPYKLELIENLIKYGTTDFEEIKKSETKDQKPEITIYAVEDFIDLCRGGHVKKTGDVDLKSFKLIKTAGAYWRGDEKNQMLTRIYGVAFKNEKELKEHLDMIEKAKKRDHRILGKKLDLFSQHNVSPGSIFWHPKGMVLWSEVEKVIREKNKKYGYGEISTPTMVKKELFETSGHWEHYRENGFWFDVENQTYVLKPMNCPEGTLIYSNKIRSYRDLPLRLAEPTGKVYRNELTGTLGGLFRLRQFVQDDGHSFCRPNQIEEEVKDLINYTQEVYELFNLPISFKFATKPDKAMGNDSLWQKAEKSLEDVLKKLSIDYKVKEKDGAFYGPKIDIHAKDAIGRDHQLTTIQLDFQMPERFDLEYIDEKGEAKRPVMIHRAILGSFDRFLGVVIEHFAGNFPVWLSPVQIEVIPIGENFVSYAEKVKKELEEHDIRVQLSDSSDTLGKRIRQAELEKIPYILVVGEKEEKDNKVNVRSRKNDSQETIKTNEFVNKVKEEIEKRSL